MKTIILILMGFSLFVSSCHENLSDLTMIQENTLGNYRVSVSGENGTIKKGMGTFKVEFRDAYTNSLVKVKNVKAEAKLQSGEKTKAGNVDAAMTFVPGMYDINYDLPENGEWLFTISFNENLSTSFILEVK